MGKTVLKILKFFILAIARSTCILTEAILLVSVSSSIDKCSLFCIKGGIFNVTPFGKISSISNPLSAMIESPGARKSKMPQSNVTCLSLDLPTYRSDTNVTAPDGRIPTKPFAVLWLL